MRRGQGWGSARWSIAGVLLICGITCTVVGLSSEPTTRSFGWFAYAPLADAVFVPGLGALFTSPAVAAGAALFIAGLLVAAFSLGWSLATRRSQ